MAGGRSNLGMTATARTALTRTTPSITTTARVTERSTFWKGRTEGRARAPHTLARGAGGTSFRQHTPQRVAARMPMLPQKGHARSSGGGPRSRNATSLPHDTRSALASPPAAGSRAARRDISRSTASTIGLSPSVRIVPPLWTPSASGPEARSRWLCAGGRMGTGTSARSIRSDFAHGGGRTQRRSGSCAPARRASGARRGSATWIKVDRQADGGARGAPSLP